MRMTKLKNTKNGENVEPQELSFIASGIQKFAATSENSLTVSYKIKYIVIIRLSKHNPRCLPKRNKNLCSYKNLCIVFAIALVIITQD